MERSIREQFFSLFSSNSCPPPVKEDIEKCLHTISDSMEKELERKSLAILSKLKKWERYLTCFQGFFREEAEYYLKQQPKEITYPKYFRLHWIWKELAKKKEDCFKMRQVC